METTEEALSEVFRNDTVTLAAFRLGVVLFTFAFIKILFVIFKYNIRLLAFYKSRKYANELSGVRSLDRVKTFADVWASEKIDFDKDDIESKSLLSILKFFGR